MTYAIGYGVEALKGTSVGSKIVSALDGLKTRGKEQLDKITALILSGKVGTILKELRSMADDAAYALFQKITDNKLSRKILEVSDKWNRKKDGKLITEEQAKILIEEAEDGTEADEILDLMEKVGVKSLGFDDLMKRLSTKAGNLLADRWDDLSKEAKETITNVIEKTTGDGRKLSLSGTEILLDEYADKTEETLTKKILYFTTEHMETSIDDNAFKILRKEWDGWDDIKKDKVDEIIQKCSKGTKMLTEDDVNVILDNCDGLSADDVVKLVIGKRVGYLIKQQYLAEEINEILKEIGYVDPPYKPGTIVTEIQLTEKKTFVRVYDKVNSRQQGGWIMEADDIIGLSPEEIQNKFALPSTPKYVCDVELEAGTYLRTGEANALYGYTGGGKQYDLLLNDTYVGNFINERNLK